MSSFITLLDRASHSLREKDDNEDTSSYNERFNKGINAFNKMCRAVNYTPEEKLDIILAYLDYVPEEAEDMINRWRDMIPFLSGKNKENHIKLLELVAKSTEIPGRQRLLTSTCLFNNCVLSVTRECFMSLANDETVDILDRVEACLYIYSSDDEDEKEVVQEILINIIESVDLYSTFDRYNAIIKFSAKKGLRPFTMSTKIKIPYDEEFVYGLQIVFFNDKQNDIRYRLLSSEVLLKMNCTDKDEKNDLCSQLLEIGDDKELDQNIRADALDIIHRVGVDSVMKSKALNQIKELGYEHLLEKEGGDMLDNAKTIYNNTQNIHTFASQADKFIEKIIESVENILPEYSEIEDILTKMIRNIKDHKLRCKAFKALNRIKIDSATFTKYSVSLSMIFVYLWVYIHDHHYNNRESIYDRIIEELIDMGDTCSSGHSIRFINILSEYDNSFKMEYDEQIFSNMVARMNAKIKNCPDEDLKSTLSMAQSELAEPEEIEVFKKFIEDEIPKLYEELREEFVDGGYTSLEEFDRIFEEGKYRAEWLN